MDNEYTDDLRAKAKECISHVITNTLGCARMKKEITESGVLIDISADMYKDTKGAEFLKAISATKYWSAFPSTDGGVMIGLTFSE